MDQGVKEISIRDLDFIRSNSMSKIIGMYSSLVDHLIQYDTPLSKHAAIRRKVGDFIWEYRHVDLDPWKDFDDEGNYIGTKSLEYPTIKY